MDLKDKLKTSSVASAYVVQGEHIWVNHDFFVFEGRRYRVVYFTKNDIWTKFSMKFFLFPLLLLPIIGEKLRKWSLKEKPVEKATGFLVLKEDFSVLKDKQIALNVSRMYKIWEFIFLDPFYKPRDLQLHRIREAYRKNTIQKIKENKYPMPTSTEEAAMFSALQRLDADIVGSEQLFNALENTIERLVELFIEISNSPTDKNIYRLRDLASKYLKEIFEVTQYLNTRKTNWKEYVLRKEEFDAINQTRQGSLDKIKNAAVEDLLSSIVPAFSTVKTISQEAIKKASDVVGGYEALERAQKNYALKQQEITEFIHQFDTEIAPQLIRGITNERT